MAPAAETPTSAAGFSTLAAARRPALPVALRFRPGAAPWVREDLHDPTVRQVLQALCRALGLQPSALEFRPLDHELGRDGAWAVQTGFEAGVEFTRRLCRIDGIATAWLSIGRSRLIASGWRYTPPPPPQPPPLSN